MTVRPNFSIVINTLNRAQYLQDTLQSLRYLRYPHFEVVVVNGPSTDGTEGILHTHADFVRAETCPATNLAKSRNIGLAASRGDVIAFLDDDAIPEPDWLDRLAHAYADPGVGVAGGPVRDDDGVNYQQFVVVSDYFTENTFFPSFEAARDAGALTRGFLRPMGANSSFRKSALMEIGGFDEVYAYYAEEVDASLRLIEAGWKIVYVADAEVHHKFARNHARDERRIPKDLYLINRSKAYFCWRHGPKRHSPAEIVREIGRWRRVHSEHLLSLCRARLIDHSTHERLAVSMDRGLADGTSAALMHLPQLPSQMCKGNAGPFIPAAPLRPTENRLKLCFVSADFPPAQMGGIARYTAIQARALAAQGHEVTVITRANGAPRVDFTDGVWVHRVLQPCPGAQLPQSYPATPLGLTEYLATVRRAVLRVYLQRGIDIVCSSIWNVEGLGCVGIPGLRSAVTLVTSFNLVARDRCDWQEPEFQKEIVQPMIRAENWLLARADLVIGSSTSIITDISRANAINISQSKTIIIPFGIPDLDRDLQTIEQQADGPVRLLFVGRFEPRKGIDLLLKAVAELAPRYPRLHVDLIGDDAVPFPGGAPIWERFRAQYCMASWFNRVRKHGVLPDSGVAEYYRSCDLFVAPSRYESFGLTYLEAMRAGKPVIGCAEGGPKEIITDGRTGLLIPPDDIAALIDAIERLVRNDASRTEMGRYAREDFVRRFTDMRMADDLSHALESLVKTSEPALRRMELVGDAYDSFPWMPKASGAILAKCSGVARP